MASMLNKSAVQNQVGGRQDVHGSVNNGPVLNFYHPPVRELGLPNFEDEKDDNDALKSLSFPQMLSKRGDIERPHRDTCQWIFDTSEYQTWRKSTQAFLWIKGKPGAGKSTLMSSLYSQIELDRLGAAMQESRGHGIHLNFFFTARGTELQRTPIGMLRSLLNQLMRQHARTRRTVRELYLDKNHTFGKPTPGAQSWEWQRRELESLLSECVLTAADSQLVEIFVDALDEAGESSAREVAQYLHGIYESAVEASVRERSACLKICVSCRHYPVASTNSGLEIRVEDNNARDITKFIHDRLNLANRLNEDIHDLAPWFELEEETAKRAQGVFQWARLVTPIIEDCIDEGEPIDVVQTRLRNVPRELADVYDYVLRSVIKPVNWSQSHKLFRWICFSQRPLSVTEIRYAMVAEDDAGLISDKGIRRWDLAPTFISSDAQMIKRIQALSGGLLEVLNTQHKWHRGPHLVQVVHQSVTEFLRSRGLAMLEHLRTRTVDHNSQEFVESQLETIVKKSHASLYWSCLMYLCDKSSYLSNLTQQPHQEQVSATKQAKRPRNEFVAEWQDEVAEKRPDKKLSSQPTRESVFGSMPFLAYAVTNLFVHAKEASMYRTRDSALTIQIELRCLYQIFTLWGLLYNLHEPFSTEFFNPGTNLLHTISLVGLHDLIRFDFASKRTLSVQLHRRDQFGNTPLHLAARANQIASAQLLVEHGANIHVRTQSLQTPLIIAIINGHTEFVTWLLSKGAKLGDALEASQKVLQEASYKGHGDVVKMLLQAGADPNAPQGEFGTALYAASWNGHVSVGHALLQAGADVNAQETLGTALHAASVHGHAKMVQLLIDAGASVNLESECFGCALYAAAGNCHTDVVKTLINAGAKINATGGKHGTALHSAVVAALFDLGDWNSLAQQDVIRVLLRNGAQVDSIGAEHGTPLQTVLTLTAMTDRTSQARKTIMPLVRLLIDAAADVNASEGVWMTPLQAAVYSGHEEMVGFLLKVGAEVDAPAIAFGTAMDIAVGQGNRSLIKLLSTAKGQPGVVLAKG